MIQLEEAGYVLENFHPGWQVVEHVDGEDKTEEELIRALSRQLTQRVLLHPVLQTRL